MEPREERKARAKKQAHEREESKRQWMEGVSTGLDNAWVSVCPHAQTSEVCSYRLVDIIDIIQDGCSICVPGKYGKWRNINVEEHQSDVQRIYQAGFDEAKMINRVRLVRLLDSMGLKGVSPEEVEPVLDQPKRNVKLFYVRALKIRGETIQVNEPNVLWHRPTDLGKSRADDSKKWGPAVCLSGLFLPQRDGQYLIRTTGLFPIDVDGLPNDDDSI